MQVVQDRLAAVELMLLQRPMITGQYTERAYHNVLLPLKDDMDAFLLWHVPVASPNPCP